MVGIPYRKVESFGIFSIKLLVVSLSYNIVYHNNNPKELGKLMNMA